MKADQAKDQYKAEQEREREQRFAAGASTDEMNAQKYDRRLRMNRKSAAASRVRRETYVENLEEQLMKYEEKVEALEEELRAQNAAKAILSDVNSNNEVVRSPFEFPELNPVVGELDIGNILSDDLFKEQ